MSHAHKAIVAITALGLCMSLGLLSAGRAEAQAPPPPPYMGEYDVNGDGAFTEADLVAFRTHWINFHKNPPVYERRADFNGDGKIDIADAQGIIQEWLRPSWAYKSSGTQVLEALAGELQAFEKIARAVVKQSTAKNPT